MSIHESEQGLISRTLSRVNQHKTEMFVAGALVITGCTSSEDSGRDGRPEVDTDTELIAECGVGPIERGAMRDAVGSGPFADIDAISDDDSSDDDVIDEVIDDILTEDGVNHVGVAQITAYRNQEASTFNAVSAQSEAGALVELYEDDNSELAQACTDVVNLLRNEDLTEVRTGNNGLLSEEVTTVVNKYSSSGWDGFDIYEDSATQDRVPFIGFRGENEGFDYGISLDPSSEGRNGSWLVVTGDAAEVEIAEDGDPVTADGEEEGGTGEADGDEGTGEADGDEEGKGDDGDAPAGGNKDEEACGEAKGDDCVIPNPGDGPETPGSVPGNDPEEPEVPTGSTTSTTSTTTTTTEPEEPVDTTTTTSTTTSTTSTTTTTTTLPPKLVDVLFCDLDARRPQGGFGVIVYLAGLTEAERAAILADPTNIYPFNDLGNGMCKEL